MSINPSSEKSALVHYAGDSDPCASGSDEPTDTDLKIMLGIKGLFNDWIRMMKNMAR